jgi:hypothetical protein
VTIEGNRSALDREVRIAFRDGAVLMPVYRTRTSISHAGNRPIVDGKIGRARFDDTAMAGEIANANDVFQDSPPLGSGLSSARLDTEWPTRDLHRQIATPAAKFTSSHPAPTYPGMPGPCRMASVVQASASDALSENKGTPIHQPGSSTSRVLVGRRMCRNARSLRLQ